MTDSKPDAGAWFETNTLAIRLVMARTKGAKMSRDRFAEATGISEATIYNYEAERTTPRRPQLIAWAMASGVDLEWLTTGQRPGEVAPPPGLEPGTLCLPVQNPYQDPLIADENVAA